MVYTFLWAWMLIFARMLSIIAGKPGSGKSYHMAGIVVDVLTDWVRYEQKHGTAFDSSIWTNMKFNIEGLNETISKRLGKDVDVEHYIHYCDNDFFNDPDAIYWWKKFPGKSLIIIDEVHMHLGRKVDYGSLDMEAELVNWVSTHRHSQQEIYFLSQHTDQFANSILGIADTLLEIVNMKSLHLPFPISVPMADFDELKRSFGIKTQYYQANVGNFRGKAVKWSGAVQRYVMTADIFRAYKSASHGSAEESLDRPDLKMTPLEGIRWFIGRHAWHLVPKFAGILAIPILGGWFLMSLPSLFASAVSGSNNTDSNNSSIVEQKEEVKDESAREQRIERIERAESGERFTPSVSDARAILPPPARTAVAGRGVIEGESASVPSGVIPRAESKREVKIVMLYQKGVVLDDSRKISIGEAFEFEGKAETLVVACAVCGVIVFESGKRIHF